MRLHGISSLSLVAACAAGGVAGQVMAAVSAPYADNFAVAPGATGSNLSVLLDRTESCTSTWTAVAGATQHSMADGSWGVATAGAYVSVDNLGGSTAQDFAVSTTVTPTGKNDAFRQTTGLYALATATGLGGWSNGDFYAGAIAYGWGTTAQMSLIHSVSTDYPAADASAPISGLTIDTTYLMTLSGHYASGGLILTFTLSEPGNSAFAPVSVNYTYATPYTGTMFGIRDDVQGGTATFNYSSFNVTNSVPEPVSLSVLGLAAMGLMARRRAVA